MQDIGINKEEAISCFWPLADTIWLISLTNSSVKLLKDSMTPEYEGEIVDFEILSDHYRRHCVYPPDVPRWEDTLSLQALRQMAAEGVRQRHFDMRFQNVQIGFEWHESYLNILTDEAGVADRALLISRRANEIRQAQFIEEAAGAAYDYVCYIEAENNSYVLYMANHASGTPLPPVASENYEQEVFDYNRRYVVPEEVAEVNRKLSIAYLQPILEAHGEYVFYATCVEHGALRDKKFRISYFDRTKNTWLLTRTDITEIREEKRQKELLKDALDAATIANRAKSEFLSRMSHDIRTPMNAIIGMTAIAGAHIDQPERVADCLNKITASSQLLLGLINEVLDMSKIESGNIVLSEEELSLPDLVESVVSMTQVPLQDKRQRFDVHLHQVKNENIISDRQRLQQVILNLLTNASKYTPEEGRIVFEISEKPSAISGVGCYEFIVADNGVGMREEFQQKLFEPFERAEDPSIRAIQGTGLGLAIVKNIVEMMNGTISVESVYGQGTRFSVQVYLKLQEQTPLDAKALLALPILVADDDEIVCRNTSRRLGDLGMECAWVMTGSDAVQKTIAAHDAGRDYFAVIIDLMMPGMNGIETTRRIRAAVGETVPIIMISAYDWSEYEDEALAAGVNDFIMKPLFSSRLVHKLKKYVERAEDDVYLCAPIASATDDFTGKRVLLVEDNALNREIAEELLTSVGVEVDCAENGQIAVEKMAASREGTYDLIFMDMQMPIMDGCEATRQIRSLSRRDVRGLPIVAMTANAFAEDIAQTRAAGMNEHMAKPIDLALLSRVLHRYLC